VAFLSSFGNALVEDRALALYRAEVVRRTRKALKQNPAVPDEPPPLLFSAMTPQTLWYGSGPDTPLALRLSETPPTDPVAQQDTSPGRVISMTATALVENDGSSSAPPRPDGSAEAITLRIERDHTYLLWLTISLEQMARDEIARLSGANDPDTIEHNKKQIDLLSILADGFAKIAAALQEYSRDPQPVLAGKAKEIAGWVGDQIQAWWEANDTEVRDWCIRLPVIGVSLGALGLTGADMTIATTVVSAIVGGPKVIPTAKALLSRRR
jgi:hypothetical protein